MLVKLQMVNITHRPASHIADIIIVRACVCAQAKGKKNSILSDALHGPDLGFRTCIALQHKQPSAAHRPAGHTGLVNLACARFRAFGEARPLAACGASHGRRLVMYGDVV